MTLGEMGRGGEQRGRQSRDPQQDSRGAGTADPTSTAYCCDEREGTEGPTEVLGAPTGASQVLPHLSNFISI